MGRNELIIKLIKDSGYSIKSFAEKCGIPYTTLHSMLKKDLGNASIDNVIIICKNLGITVEQLENLDTEVIQKENDNSQSETPVIIAASTGGLTNVDERTNELLRAKQELCGIIYAANLDMRQIQELKYIVNAFENL